jgi:hypothetical protein
MWRDESLLVLLGAGGVTVYCATLLLALRLLSVRLHRG